MLGSSPRALPCAHSPACSNPFKRQQASVTSVLSSGPRRLRSWEPKIDPNARRHRCSCSYKRPPSETDSDVSHKEDEEDKSEAKPHASTRQNEDFKGTEMSDFFEKILRGAPGGPARKELPLQFVWKKDLTKLGLALPFTLGIPGTLALALGYYLHIDPYGHLHWSVPDAITGLVWALPVAFVDACLLLPDLRETPSVTKQRARRSQSHVSQKSDTSKAQPDQSGASSSNSEAKSKEDAAMEHFATLMSMMVSERRKSIKSEASTSSEATSAEVSTSGVTRPSLDTKREKKQSREAAQESMIEKLTKRQTQPLSAKVGFPSASEENMQSIISWAYIMRHRGLVHSWQRETVTANPWLQNMPITEVVSIVLRQFPWMMFSKAILLTGLAGWLTDRFYQAGAEDVMVLLGDQPIPTSEAAQWTALAVIVGVYTGLALYTPKRMGQFGLSSSLLSMVKKDKKAEVGKDLEKVMKRMQQKSQQRQQTKVAISGLRLVAGNIAYGSSYILTGNLLAPYVGSVASKFLFSFWQRVKHEQYSSDFKGSLEDMLRHSTAMLKADNPETF